MRKSALTLLCTSCVFGAFGAFCRWLQNMTAYDEGGLYKTGNVWGYALSVLLIAAAITIAVLLLRIKRRGLVSPEGYENAMASATRYHKPVSIVIALLMLAGSFLLVFKAGESVFSTLYRVLALLGILSAVGFLITASCARNRADPFVSCFGSVLPVLFGCFWLIVSYRANASSPIIWGYAPELLAIALSLLGFYYAAGFAFGSPKPYKSIFCCCMGACLCVTALPDERLTALSVMLVGVAAMLLFYAWSVAANLTEPKEEAEEEIVFPAPDSAEGSVFTEAEDEIISPENEKDE